MEAVFWKTYRTPFSFVTCTVNCRLRTFPVLAGLAGGRGWAIEGATGVACLWTKCSPDKTCTAWGGTLAPAGFSLRLT